MLFRFRAAKMRAMELSGKRVTVAGLGRFGGGILVTRWLVEQGARVLVTDTASTESLADSVAQLAGLPVAYRLGEHVEEDFARADLVVASPAVAYDSKYLQAARAASVPVTTEIRLFIERCPARIVAVTGTKGKSTTTAMLGRMLTRRITTHVGGNIGLSLLADLPKIQADDLVVLELSSFMLEYLAEAQWSPHVAVVTMIAPDHLDRHKTMEAYVAAKANLIRFQTERDYTVLNETCPRSRELSKLTRGKVLLYGLENRRALSLKVPGQHNQLNAQAALAAASIFEVSWDDAQAALTDFRGLEHRLELVHEQRNIQYFNDSIATIPEAAIAALDSFPPRTVIQIVGGYDKGLSLAELAAALAQRAKAAMCIGATGPTIARLAGEGQHQNNAPFYQCGDLATAMKLAKAMAVPGDVVLLSPGCASFDQFRNFQERGKAFAALAREE